ncbi:hypothetical protein [Sulfuritalea sp.]|uniref:hypothetical protein n=1 Tax=Sulfuritalea sp. TaxID=2480090 RepID=UPI001AC352CA|nr:hypothetical protein [Sulfuritalea sp.]MBN8474508.1 hypothetical protein [Sulfuritalea sp.]
MTSKQQRQPGRAGAEATLFKHIAADNTGNTTANQRNSQADRGVVADSTDTLGLVADLHDKEGLRLVEEAVRLTGDQELRGVLELAVGLGMRYLVAAGRFDGKGIFSALCAEDSVAILSWGAANERMNEGGSRKTEWLVMPAPLMALLNKAAAQQATKGGAQ